MEKVKFVVCQNSETITCSNDFYNYKKSMNYQKRLINIFRAFVEKAFLPQIQKYQGNTQDWNRFNALLNSELINYSELQGFVDTLPVYNSQLQSKEAVYTNRKRSESGSFHDIYENRFSPHRAKGDRLKEVVVEAKPFESENQHNYSSSKKNMRQTSKQKAILLAKTQFFKEDSYHNSKMISMPSIGSPPISQSTHPNSTVLVSLNKLLKQLTDNQVKVQMWADSKVN